MKRYPLNTLRAAIARWQQRATRWWESRDAPTRALPGYLQRAVQRSFRYDTQRAAALAYYTVFSIFPLLLLLAVGIGRVLGAVSVQAQIASALRLFLPDAAQPITDLLLESVSQGLTQDSSFTLLALGGLVWSGLGLFTNVSTALDLIFGAQRRRSMWQQRLVAVTMTITLIVLVVLSFLVTGVLLLARTVFFNQASTWINLAFLLVPLGFNITVFVLAFRFVPARPVHWDSVWPAAVFGAVGWELAKAGFGWYLANFANYQLVYGSIATVIVLLFWAFLLASIFLFSAELCAQLNNWWEAELREQIAALPEPQTPRLPGPR